tara:strand:+ start:8066 stop:8953 length:888 start_codon:yes stop_codon:yes gene_type:complete
VNIHLENINLKSASGPNSFANKLIKYSENCTFDHSNPPDVHLCFIETYKSNFKKPLFLRLDGIYINTAQNYNAQNLNIEKTYHAAQGVIFQSEFGKKLIFKRFGEHKNFTIIKNGADIKEINVTPVLNFNRHRTLWACASNWRPHKRLQSNIQYFLNNSDPQDGLIIAGFVPKHDQILRDNIYYVGNLNQKQLFSLYKRAEYFIHLAFLDCCPNVVIDARACGCKVICTDSGGTKEIAGNNAVVIKDLDWDFEPLDLYNPVSLEFNNLSDQKGQNSDLDMSIISKKYLQFIKESL